MVVTPVGIIGDAQRSRGLKTGRIVVQGQRDDRLGTLEQHRRIAAQVAMARCPLHAAVMALLDPAVIARYCLVIDGSGGGKATSVKTQACGLGFDQ